MDFSKIERNASCPCGSGKKFKKCHLGRESELVAERINLDPYQAAQMIMGLPACDHPRACQMAADLQAQSPAGKTYEVVIKDLEAYLALGLYGQETAPQGAGGIMINPQKTRVLAPGQIFLALSPQADESTVLHQLAHALDLISGSALPPGRGQALAYETGLPVELLEHPQEFGERLMELAQRFGVELDAEDEIVAFLARHHLLLPGGLLAEGQRESLVEAAEKSLRFLRDNQAELDARIRTRAGYTGAGAPDKRPPEED
ncbi:MAG: SEC-C domain-containing protein [Pseudomonadota bacterium]